MRFPTPKVQLQQPAILPAQKPVNYVSDLAKDVFKSLKADRNVKRSFKRIAENLIKKKKKSNPKKKKIIGFGTIRLNKFWGQIRIIKNILKNKSRHVDDVITNDTFEFCSWLESPIYAF
jgi:hypothetical protein